MSADDLRFEIVSTGETIYDPLTLVAATPQIIQVTNFGSDDLADLGMWIVTATGIGDVDNPATFPPETDFQDLMTFGQATFAGLTPQGGLKLTLPQNGGGTTISYVTREQGSTKNNKLSFVDLASEASATFTLTMETPPSVSARRLFINLVLE